MLKIDRVGKTAINPFPVWPPLPPFGADEKHELDRILSLPSETLLRRIDDLSRTPNRLPEFIMPILGVIYAHFYGYQDAPDLSDIVDGESHLIRIKAVLEQAMLTHVIKTDLPDTSSFDAHQDRVAEYFERLSLTNGGVHHPFFDYVAQEMPADQMKEFLWLEVIRNEVVDDEVAMLVPGLQHSMKQVVASNLWDECGNGKIDGFHTTWLVRLLAHDDQWSDFMRYRGTRPWFTMCTSHSFNSLLTSPGKAYHAYGTFLINESWVADHFEKILAGMDRVGITDEDRRIYFDAHYKIDQHHRLEMIEGLRQQFPALPQSRLRQVISGAHQAISAGVVMYDHMLNYFGQRRHA